MILGDISYQKNTRVSEESHVSHLLNRAEGLRFLCLVTWNHGSILVRFYYIMIRLYNSHVTMIRHLYFLRADNMNNLPTSFYFLVFFYHKSNTWIPMTQTYIEQKNEKEKQPYDPAMWFLGIYQRKSTSAQRPVASLQCKNKTPKHSKCPWIFMVQPY